MLSLWHCSRQQSILQQRSETSGPSSLRRNARPNRALGTRRGNVVLRYNYGCAMKWLCNVVMVGQCDYVTTSLQRQLPKNSLL